MLGLSRSFDAVMLQPARYGTPRASTHTLTSAWRY